MSKRPKYTYIGPEGERINIAIREDRLRYGLDPRAASCALLEGKAQMPVLGPATAMVVMEAIALLEARRHEGRAR